MFTVYQICEVISGGAVFLIIHYLHIQGEKLL